MCETFLSGQEKKGVAEMSGGETPRGAYGGCAAKSLLLAGTKVWVVGGWVGGWVGGCACVV
jgi:hypothetical protein